MNPVSRPMRCGLVVDADLVTRNAARRCLARLGCDAVEAADAADALVQLELAVYDVVIVDLHLALGERHRLLETVRQRQPGVPVLTLTADGSLAECVAAIRAGATDCLVKPVHGPTLEDALRDALARTARPPVDTRGAQLERDPCPLVGESRVMRDLLRCVGQLAFSDAPVLIVGESGAGKDALARYLHELSPRGRAPFVVVSCGALLELGADYELGLAFAQAAGGTLVLDEVAELPAVAQAALALRLARPRRPGDARVVALTRRELDELRAVGILRDDLVFRLDVMRLDVPALRDRREDIVPLALHILTQLSGRLGRPLALARDTLSALLVHAWPGNVRELENTLERMAIFATGATLGPELLPPRVRATVAGPVKTTPPWRGGVAAKAVN
jgi:DNA-binding NtrC family response regulator